MSPGLPVQHIPIGQIPAIAEITLIIRRDGQVLARTEGPKIALPVQHPEPVVISHARNQKAALPSRLDRIAEGWDRNERNIVHAKPCVLEVHAFAHVEIHILEPEPPGRDLALLRVAVGEGAVLDPIVVLGKPLKKATGHQAVGELVVEPAVGDHPRLRVDIQLQLLRPDLRRPVQQMHPAGCDHSAGEELERDVISGELHRTLDDHHRSISLIGLGFFVVLDAIAGNLKRLGGSRRGRHDRLGTALSGKGRLRSGGQKGETDEAREARHRPGAMAHVNP